MNISTDTDQIRFNKELGSVYPGDCIEFEKVPHSKHADGSIFMVLRIPSQYIAYNERKPNNTFRIMVANLETGECSLVTKTRAVRFVNADVIKNAS